MSEPSTSDPPIVQNPLFFLDYDGTLAPIVDDPTAAHPHADVPALLEHLAEHHPVWIVTGRYLGDLETFFEKADLLELGLPAIGLHGTQEGVLGGEVESLASDEAVQALSKMRRALPDIEGVEVEDKGDAFAVHYRAVNDKAHESDALEQLRDWADQVPAVLEAIWGKKVVELHPRGLTKGTAVRRILERHPDTTPVYLGDDTTDEDAFEELEHTDGAVTIRVGEGETSAHYRLDDPDDVVHYLRMYV